MPIYRMQGSQANGRRLFLECMKRINELNEKPQFYNILLDNCTTSLWLNSRINPEHLPFPWKIPLCVYVPEYRYESGRFDTRISLFDLQKQSRINARAHAADPSSDFSTRIRDAIDVPGS
ncbi:MAG: lipoprotein N-acyltransferase Lnb domain-containing protein [Gammaproteobacteria bacterium]